MTTHVSYKDESGQTRYTGGPDLKSSQAYPKEFGEHVQQLFDLHKRDLDEWADRIATRAAQTSIQPADWAGGDVWSDADLSPVFRWLLKQ